MPNQHQMPGQYPAPPQQYNVPPQPPSSSKKSLWITLGAVGAVVALVAVGFVIKGWAASLVDVDKTDFDTENSDTLAAGEEDFIGDYGAGDCIPSAPVNGTAEFDEALPCDDDTAFYEITDNVGVKGEGYDASTEASGMEAIVDVCGSQYGVFNPGEGWYEGYYVYDQLSNDIERILCLRAIDKPDADGYVPTFPGEGDCFDSTKWRYTLGCDSDLADMRVDAFVDLPSPAATEEAAAESAGCEGIYYPLAPQNDEITQVMCVSEL